MDKLFLRKLALCDAVIYPERNRSGVDADLSEGLRSGYDKAAKTF